MWKFRTVSVCVKLEDEGGGNGSNEQVIYDPRSILLRNSNISQAHP